MAARVIPAASRLKQQRPRASGAVPIASSVERGSKSKNDGKVNANVTTEDNANGRMRSINSRSPTSRNPSKTPSRNSRTFRKRRVRRALRRPSASRKNSSAVNHLSAGGNSGARFYFSVRGRDAPGTAGETPALRRAAGGRFQAAHLLHVMQAVHQVKLPPLRCGKRPQNGMMWQTTDWATPSGRCSRESIRPNN